MSRQAERRPEHHGTVRHDRLLTVFLLSRMTRPVRCPVKARPLRPGRHLCQQSNPYTRLGIRQTLLAIDGTSVTVARTADGAGDHVSLLSRCAGEVGGDDVGGVPVEGDAGAVVAHGGARVRGGLVDVTERDAGIQS